MSPFQGTFYGLYIPLLRTIRILKQHRIYFRYRKRRAIWKKFIRRQEPYPCSASSPASPRYSSGFIQDTPTGKDPQHHAIAGISSPALSFIHLSGVCSMRIAKIFSLLGMLAAGTTVASAQCDGLPRLGDIFYCVVTDGGKTLVAGDTGAEESVGSSAAATLQVTGYNSNPCEVILSTLDFESKSFSIPFGEFETFLSPGSKSTATITQTVPGSPSLFPAAIRLELNLTATSSAIPGKEFRAQSPLVLQSTRDITELPLSRVELEQTGGAIGFGSEGAGTGGTAFGIREVRVTLNGD